MEIHEQDPLPHQPSARHVGIQQQCVASCVSGRVRPKAFQHFRVVFQPAIVPIHELGLAEVDRLATDVDEGSSQENEPQLSLRPADVGHRLACPPMIPENRSEVPGPDAPPPSAAHAAMPTCSQASQHPDHPTARKRKASKTWNDVSSRYASLTAASARVETPVAAQRLASPRLDRHGTRRERGKEFVQQAD